MYFLNTVERQEKYNTVAKPKVLHHCAKSVGNRYLQSCFKIKSRFRFKFLLLSQIELFQ